MKIWILVLVIGAGVVFLAGNDESGEVPKQVGTQTASESESSPKVSSSENKLPILKNLGVSIDVWNKQTNLAGDLIFDKRVVYDDGYSSNNKVFLDFGSKDKYRVNDIGAIEYWFYVPRGTKVRAPIDGTVQVVFFEHTKDWGVNLVPKGSRWLVSFEHLVNLSVVEGDVVRAGDIVGEAAPRIGSAIAMVELVVWTGGESIVKYCPYNFLDESLKPVYKEKINQLALDWEEFTGQDIYKEEAWVFPGCLVDKIVER